MKKNKRIYVFFMAALLSMLTVARGKAADHEWSERMQKLLGSFTTLAPYIYSTAAFQDPQNKQAIIDEIQKFKKLAHNVHMEANDKAKSQDPSLQFISAHLEDDSSEALAAFKADNREYARFKLKKLTKNCFQCHSRSDQGPEFAGLNLKLSESSMRLTELADVFTATRQFDRALETLLKIFDNSEAAEKDPVEFQRAVRNYLAIAVRVKEDPALASALVEKVLAYKQAPQYLRDDASRWRLDIAKWKTEKNSSRPDLLKSAMKLIDQAKDAQEYPMDNRSDVLYLRATAILHKYLETAKDKKKMSDAMYSLGHCYEVLNDIGQWYLQETYFESCIRNLPHSAIARRCYNRFEMNVFIGYSGSGGVYIPDSERQRLQELRGLAFSSKKEK